MSREPQRIVDVLTDGTDVAAAALRIAIYVEELVETPEKDAGLVDKLEAAGCHGLAPVQVGG